LRDSVGNRWYWHVRLQGHGPVLVHLERPGLLGGYGPAISVDGGQSYEWAQSSYGERRCFTLRLEPARDTRICATLPYGPSELRAFLGALGQAVVTGSLCRSEGGRPVALLRVPAAGRARHRLLLTARHHACETVGSWVLEGVLRAVLDQRAAGRGWATMCDVIAIPFVDIDGVVRGDQGKGRTPHDHNRDYWSSGRYASVHAIRRAKLLDELPTVALDFHTPGLIGPLEERPLLVASGDRHDVEVVGDFAAEIGGGRAEAPEVMVFDEAWNSTRTEGQRCFAAWARSHPAVALATSVEYPNATVRGLPVSPSAARDFGRRIVAALGHVFD
jgi:Zinc carboxypeptidase